MHTCGSLPTAPPSGLSWCSLETGVGGILCRIRPMSSSCLFQHRKDGMITPLETNYSSLSLPPSDVWSQKEEPSRRSRPFWCITGWFSRLIYSLEFLPSSPLGLCDAGKDWLCIIVADGSPFSAVFLMIVSNEYLNDWAALNDLINLISRWIYLRINSSSGPSLSQCLNDRSSLITWYEPFNLPSQPCRAQSLSPIVIRDNHH